MKMPNFPGKGQWGNASGEKLESPGKGYASLPRIPPQLHLKENAWQLPFDNCKGSMYPNTQRSPLQTMTPSAPQSNKRRRATLACQSCRHRKSRVSTRFERCLKASRADRNLISSSVQVIDHVPYAANWKSNVCILRVLARTI